MAGSTLTVGVDAALLTRQLGQLGRLLERLPKRRARRFQRKALRLVRTRLDSKLLGHKLGTAAAAGDLRLQVRVGGMDELIAAALRAAKGDLCHG